VVLLLLPLDDGGFVLGFPLLGELLGLVLLGLLVSGVVLLGLEELGLLELGLLELGLAELGLLLDGLLLVDELLLLGDADELSGDVLELLPVLGDAEVCPDWSLELCPAVELLGELVLWLVDDPLGEVELWADVLPVLLVD
jgi:hypothetical protein